MTYNRQCGILEGGIIAVVGWRLTNEPGLLLFPNTVGAHSFEHYSLGLFQSCPSLEYGVHGRLSISACMGYFTSLA